MPTCSKYGSQKGSIENLDSTITNSSPTILLANLVFQLHCFNKKNSENFAGLRYSLLVISHWELFMLSEVDLFILIYLGCTSETNGCKLNFGSNTYYLSETLSFSEPHFS